MVKWAGGETMHKLTLFYDGDCPLCVREMQQLRRLDRQHVLQLVDIQRPETAQLFAQIDLALASQVLLALTADGRLLRGLDSTHAAWSAIGLGYRTAWLRWPLIRPLADLAYRWFAANRYRVSRWLTGQARCSSGQCRR